MLSPPRWPAWILEWIVPTRTLEYLLGDLSEEYALRARSGSSRAATRWYCAQIGKSLPPLINGAFTQAGWLRTLAVALVVFFGVIVVDAVARMPLMGLALDRDAYLVIRAAVGMMTFALGGYVAAWIRRPAALVLAVTLFGTILFMLLTATRVDPLWFASAFLIGGPLAAIGAGAAASRHLLRRHKI